MKYWFYKLEIKFRRCWSATIIYKRNSLRRICSARVLVFLVMEVIAFSGYYSAHPLSKKPPDESSTLSPSEKPSPSTVPPSSKTYKSKLLNIFGEEVSQRISDGKNNKDSPTQEDVLMHQEVQIKEIGEGAWIEVPLSDEEWARWSKPWTKTLVMKVMGKNINFESLENNLRRKWAKKDCWHAWRVFLGTFFLRRRLCSCPGW